MQMGTREQVARGGAAATLILCVGLLVHSLLGLDQPGVDLTATRIVAAVGALLGIVGLFLPWSRVPRWAYALLPVGACAAIVIGDLVTGLSAAPEATAYFTTGFFLTLTWSGLTLRPGATLLLAPLAAGAFAIVALADDSAVPMEMVIITIPAGVLVGEALAWMMRSLRKGRQLELRRVDDIEMLASSVAVLRHQQSTLDETANLLARLANDVFRGDQVTTVLRGRDGRLVPVSLGDRGEPPSESTAGLVTESIGNGDVQLVAENGSTLLVIPLVGPTEIGGAVVVRRPTTGGDPFTLHLARLFASQAGTALEQIQVIENLSEDLRRDELTGIGNRRHASALVDSLRPGDAVVLVDLDNLKTINDTFGHRAGDEILRSLGAHLRQSVRDSDTVARFGGDEFVLVAREADDLALMTAERLLSSWRAREPGSTFSAGVAVHHPDELPEQTLEHADQALYRAKAGGRNQACNYASAPMRKVE